MGGDTVNMGKKASWWFSAIKRLLTCNNKKLTYVSAKKNAKEKKKSRRIPRRGEIKSFLFREPSSIEKILGELDKQDLLVSRPPTSQQSSIPSALPLRPNSPRVSSPRAAPPETSSYGAPSPSATSPRAASPSANSPRTASPSIISPRAASPRSTSLRAATPRAASPREASPRVSSPRAPYPAACRKQNEISYANIPEPTLTLHLSATKIQAAYRRYMARRCFRSLKGLARLQGVVRSRSVKRQTVNAIKQMQFLLRVQTQIQSRRTQMLENQALQSQAYRNDKEVESTLSKWSQPTEADDDWDNTTLTKEEVEARRRGKVEAAIKRERAMTYSYSYQLSKSNAKSAVNIRVGRIPWWWNWLEHHVPSGESHSVSKNAHLTPPRAISEHKPSPWRLSHNFRQLHSDFDHESVTPRSTKSAAPVWGKQMHTPRRTSPLSSSSISNYPRRRASAANSPFRHSMRDDDSLMSCPPFSGPNYMSPTISAKAKFRGKSIPENIGTPTNSSRRRLSFPLTPNSVSSKWSRGSGKDATSRTELESVGDHMSVDSTVSTPTVVGRKPFNRFV